MSLLNVAQNGSVTGGGAGEVFVATAFENLLSPSSMEADLAHLLIERKGILSDVMEIVTGADFASERISDLPANLPDRQVLANDPTFLDRLISQPQFSNPLSRSGFIFNSMTVGAPSTQLSDSANDPANNDDWDVNNAGPFCGLVDGRYILSVRREGAARTLYITVNGRNTAIAGTGSNSQSTNAVYNPNNKYLTVSDERRDSYDNKYYVNLHFHKWNGISFDYIKNIPLIKGESSLYDFRMAILSNDGRYIYCYRRSQSQIERFDLTAPFDFARFVGSASAIPDEIIPNPLFDDTGLPSFSPDGRLLYVPRRDVLTVYELRTPHLITEGGYIALGSQDLSGARDSNDQTRRWHFDPSTHRAYRSYFLRNDSDGHLYVRTYRPSLDVERLSTSTPMQFTQLSTGGQIYGLRFMNGGRSIIFRDVSASRIYTGQMTTPYDLSSLTLDAATHSFSYPPAFNSDGTKFYRPASFTSIRTNIEEYTVSTPFTFEGATLSGTFSLNNPRRIQGVWLAPNDTDLYVSSTNNPHPVGRITMVAPSTLNASATVQTVVARRENSLWGGDLLSGEGFSTDGLTLYQNNQAYPLLQPYGDIDTSQPSAPISDLSNPSIGRSLWLYAVPNGRMWAYDRDSNTFMDVEMRGLGY